jgi:hypothetical protein
VRTWIVFAAYLLGAIPARAEKTPPSLQVIEDKMRFHLLPRSSLELPSDCSSRFPEDLV